MSILTTSVMVDTSVMLLRSSMNSNNYTCIKDGVVATSSFAFVLSFFYLVLGAVCCFQLVRLIFNKHRVLHYQGFFFIMCLSWCVLRWVQFLFLNANLTTTSVNWLFLFLDTFPLNVQFACFSLLVIYFAEIVHKKTWRRYMETRFKWAYLIANCFFLVWTLTFIIAELATSDSGSSDPSSSNTTADDPCPAGETAQAPLAADITTTLWAIFAGTIFLVLVSFLAYYGYKVFLLLRIDSSFGMLFSSRTTSSPVKILAFSAIIFLIYTSRSIYDYVTAANVGVFFISVGFQWNPDGAVFLLFLIWEILPLTFVILFFWKLPSTNQMSSRDSIETPESIDDEAQPLNSTISIQVPDTSPHPPFMGTTPGKSPNFSWVDEYTDPSSSQNSFNTPHTPAHQYFSRVASTGFIPYAVTPVSSSDARNALAVPHEMSCTPGYSTFPQSAFHSSSVDD